MSYKYKVGDKVREIDTKDEGIVVKIEDESNKVWVEWLTGECKGLQLWVYSDNIELVSSGSHSFTIVGTIEIENGETIPWIHHHTKPIEDFVKGSNVEVLAIFAGIHNSIKG